MRKKTDAKRQEIIDIAYRLFRANGFELTSMSKIRSQVGGSKATLYNYFSSKEELFVECMLDIAEDYLEEIFSYLQTPADNIKTALQSFGENLLRLVCSHDMVAARRLMIAEAGRSGVGKMFYERILSRQEQIATFLGIAMNTGKLRLGDTHIAAAQLRALLEIETFEPYILCVHTTPPDDAAITAATERAVDVFLRAYAPDTNQENGSAN